MSERLRAAISAVADLVPNGVLLADTDPVEFCNTLRNHIASLTTERDKLKALLRDYFEYPSDWDREDWATEARAFLTTTDASDE